MDDGLLARSWLFARIVASIATFIITVTGNVTGIQNDFVRLNAKSLSNEETESTIALVQTHSLVHTRIRQAPDEQEDNGQVRTGHESWTPEVSKQVSSELFNAVETLAEGTQLLRNAKPLAWLHVQETGDWLANTLIHLPGMCPKVPPSLVIDEKTFGQNKLENFTNHFPIQDSCPGGMLELASSKSVGTAYESQYKNHGIVLMNQPERRIVDGYNNNLHDWPQWRMYPANIREYAEVVQGCVVKMLSRNGEREQVCAGPLPTQDEVELAKRRLEEGFVFVGLTDQLDLSICLAHKMFGGVCTEAEFHLGPPAKSRLLKKIVALDDLGNFTDTYDGELYEVAVKVFQRQLEKYDVSQNTCEWCFRTGWNSFFPPIEVASSPGTLPGPPIQSTPQHPFPTFDPSFPLIPEDPPQTPPALEPST